MEATHSDECVSKFLAGLIELGGLYTVDDTPDRFIRSRVTNEVVRINTESKSQPLAIYGTYNPDALIINPFSEGEAKSVQATKFFQDTNICLAMNILAMVKKLVELCIQENTATNTKNKKQDAAPALDLKLVNLISPVAKDVDEKVLQELKTISKPVTNFFMIYYNKKSGCTEVTSILTSEVKKKAFDSKSVRNKTWTILETLLLRLLGTDDLAEFLYKPKTNTCRVFEGFAFTMVKLYSRLNEYSRLLIDKDFDTTTLESHLNYFEQYAKTAYWCHGAMVFDETRQKAPTISQNMPMSPITPASLPIAPVATPMTPMATPIAAVPQPVMPIGMPVMPVMPMPQMGNIYGQNTLQIANTRPDVQVVAENPFAKI